MTIMDFYSYDPIKHCAMVIFHVENNCFGQPNVAAQKKATLYLNKMKSLKLNPAIYFLNALFRIFEAEVINVQ